MTWYGATVRELITDQLRSVRRDKCTGLRQRKKARALSAWHACRMETTKAGEHRHGNASLQVTGIQEKQNQEAWQTKQNKKTAP